MLGAIMSHDLDVKVTIKYILVIRDQLFDGQNPNPSCPTFFLDEQLTLGCYLFFT